MADWDKVGECCICGAERKVSLYRGKWYCWMDLKVKKDHDNTDHIERGYKKFHKLMSGFKNTR